MAKIQGKQIIIIGAGIGGLFMAYELLKLDKNNKITILDKNPNTGGRLYTSYFAGDRNAVDLGAGRLNVNNHPKLLDLCNELNLELLPFSYKPLHYCNFDINELKKNVNTILNTQLNDEKGSFYEYCKNNFSNNFIENLSLYTGYNSLMNENFSVLDGIRLLKDHPETQFHFTETQSKWFSVKKGFQTILNSIISEIKDKIQFIPNANVIEICEINDSFQVGFVDRERLIVKKADTIFSTVPPKDLLKIKFQGNVKHPTFLNKIQTVPLFKGFIKYENKWWDQYNLADTCVFANTYISKLYFPSKNNSIWFYCDGLNAVNTDKYIKNKNNIEVIISKHLNNINLDSERNFEFMFKYWKEGISFFGLDYKYTGLNFHLIHQNFHICSDIFTNSVGWIEGSLLSVASALKHFNNVK